MILATTTALSAFLLFLVQPIVAHAILPWFGGTAAVWTTCLVFFQAMLPVGYAYADVINRRLAPAPQSLLHGALLVASAAWLPIGVDVASKPPDADNPIGRILLLLGGTIGLPYLLLATTGPLMQAWAGRHRDTPRTYRLYALSNAGSLLALVAYPTIVEPRLTALEQTRGWSVGYAAFVVLALAAAWRAGHDRRTGESHDRRTGEGRDRPDDESRIDAEAKRASPAGGEQLLWMLLALLGTALLLGVTNHITRDIATIPFLWVLPLTLYLLSFILCFQGGLWHWRRGWTIAGCGFAIAMIFGLGWHVDWTGMSVVPGLMPVADSIALYSAGLFSLCMFCHGELARRAPGTRHLTRFYLMIATGGALGGLLVGVVAPLALSWHWELSIALVLFVLVAVVLADARVRWVAAPALALCAWGAIAHVGSVRSDSVEIDRNFYGALRVKSESVQGTPDAVRALLHGSINHGTQIRLPGMSRRPTTYYGETSGVGRTIIELQSVAETPPMRVGLVGMGVGTLAAYGRTGDVYRFYEVNPAVVDLARRRFTFLDESRATVETVSGDARLSLEREPPQRFDLLVLDAFSGDAIPAHLLTREAALVYGRHLTEDGVLAVHISNRYLDLTGICRHLADALDRQAWLVVDLPRRFGADPSQWVIVTSNRSVIDRLRADGNAREIAQVPGLRPWTDDFNSLFQILQ